MSFLRPKRVLLVATRCVMRIVSLLSMWVRLIVDNFRVYDEMNNSASRPRATRYQSGVSEDRLSADPDSAFHI